MDNAESLRRIVARDPRAAVELLRTTPNAVIAEIGPEGVADFYATAVSITALAVGGRPFLVKCRDLRKRLRAMLAAIDGASRRERSARPLAFALSALDMVRRLTVLPTGGG